MLTVSNTSPILNLSIIGKLELLQDQFTTVIVPPAVISELRIQENIPGTGSIRTALKEGWIKIEKVQNHSMVQLLLRELDEGEAEAIALSVEVKSDLILLDESEARRIVRNLALKTTGVLGILLRASKKDSSIIMADEINNLRKEAGFYISTDLERKILGIGIYKVL